ncbi:TolB amino-terminal domain-containing protein [Rubrimonas cliftonensis]|uniref:TolB amino-terminal domain-containing protein n=2 Tax=Rubrimonas cliftonensis TaxID=89524 RepID=A0A1H4GDC0_9RHOB|nr:TolB amino-terminal domain-containing protein [Rubrimonas cliftonensis]
MRRWRLQEQDCRLTSDDRVEALTPKAAAVLTALVRRRGELVSQDALLGEVWRGLTVSPQLVREYVFDLRTALGDDARAPVYIETVRGKGFRLIGPVELAPPQVGRPARPPAIAILRPDVFSDDPRWRHVADALAEDLTTDLARFPDVAVIARQSAFGATGVHQDLRDAARALGADYLLESSLAPGGEKLRATFQLIHGEDGLHVWAERWDEPVADLSELSATLAARVANAVAGWSGEMLATSWTRLRRRPAASLDAYENYLLCLQHEHSFEPEHRRLTIEYGRRATELDPNFARPWLLLYFLYSGEGCAPFFKTDPERSVARRAAIERALELDPRDPMILAEAAASAAAHGQAGRAPDLLARAADLGRNQAEPAACLAAIYALVLADIETSRRMFEIALRLDPAPPAWYRNVEAQLCFAAGDYERCIALGRAYPDLASTRVFGALAAAASGAAGDEVCAELRTRRPAFDFEGFRHDLGLVAPEVARRYDKAVRRLLDA